ncbi:MAG: ArsR/SmtB family transcription factor [Nitriliruptoraceae bacterium]
MRMVDLRPSSSPSALTLDVEASAGAELLRLIGVLVDLDGSEGYDVGPDRIEQLRQRLPEGVLDQLTTLDVVDNSFHVLSLLAADLPVPCGVDELLGVLDADPGIAWRLLLGHHAGGHEHGDHDLAERITDGDPDAIATVSAWDVAIDEPLGRLLAVTPEAHGAELTAAIRAVRPLWDELEREAMSAIARDVAYRRAQVEEGRDVASIVLEATNGYELAPAPSVRRVLLLPSYWIRPWIVIGSRHDAEVITTVVADQFVSLPSEAPSPALLRLFKALGDEGRLKLLRRMSTGPISLGEATAELDVAKATAHHHLSILRQAGLVATRGEGRNSRYSLREDPAEAAREALTGYIRPNG